MTAFIDTCVLCALTNPDEEHHGWSNEKLIALRMEGPVIVPNIVYCEFSVSMSSIDEVNAVIQQFGFERVAENDTTLFEAGKAFKKYKENNKGPKLNVLPDFIIGAVAAAYSEPLVTLNPRDFSGYFPNIQLISP